MFSQNSLCRKFPTTGNNRDDIPIRRVKAVNSKALRGFQEGIQLPKIGKNPLSFSKTTVLK